MMAGLPDIEGIVDSPFLLFKTLTDAFNGYDTDNHYLAEEGSAGIHSGFQFKASNSNAIYGNSNTVQPPAISLIAQIKY